MTFVVGSEPRSMSHEEIYNPAFTWTAESVGGVVIYTCDHKHHADIGSDWICEPCEHCGVEVTGADWYTPEFEELSFMYHRHSVPKHSGYYILHPCGHHMVDLRFVKEEEGESDRLCVE